MHLIDANESDVYIAEVLINEGHVVARTHEANSIPTAAASGDTLVRAEAGAQGDHLSRRMSVDTDSITSAGELEQRILCSSSGDGDESGDALQRCVRLSVPPSHVSSIFSSFHSISSHVSARS